MVYKRVKVNDSVDVESLPGWKDLNDEQKRELLQFEKRERDSWDRRFRHETDL